MSEVERTAEKGLRPRCPGCGHSCCPYPGLECGGDSDAVLACGGTCRGCGWSLDWPLAHSECANLPRVLSPGVGPSS